MRRRWWNKRTRIAAVHDNDLEQLLSSLGVLEQIKEGECSCIICQAPVNLGNLGAVLPTDDNISFVCDLPSCVAKASSSLEGGDEW